MSKKNKHLITHEIASAKTAVNDKKVMNVIVSSLSQDLLNNLIVGQYLATRGVTEDNAAKIVNFIDKSSVSTPHGVVAVCSLTDIAEKTEIAYPTAQRIVKNLLKGSILIKKGSLLYQVAPDVKEFLELIQSNKQLLFTYKVAQEEQLDMLEELEPKPDKTVAIEKKDGLHVDMTKLNDTMVKAKK